VLAGRNPAAAAAAATSWAATPASQPAASSNAAAAAALNGRVKAAYLAGHTVCAGELEAAAAQQAGSFGAEAATNSSLLASAVIFQQSAWPMNLHEVARQC
jgi:hypothetical protein